MATDRARARAPLPVVTVTLFERYGAATRQRHNGRLTDPDNLREDDPKNLRRHRLHRLAQPVKTCPPFAGSQSIDLLIRNGFRRLPILTGECWLAPDGA